MIRRVQPDPKPLRWREELLKLEQRLLDPEVRHSVTSTNPLLHPDYLEFGSSGRVYNKEMIIGMMIRQTPGAVRIRDFDVRELSDDVALVTYRTIGTEGIEIRRSSIWVRQSSRWQVIFHQGTKIPSRSLES